MAIIIDASPLQTEHKYRGIGYYVRNLLMHLDGAPYTLLTLPPRGTEENLLLQNITQRGFRLAPYWRPRWPRYRFQWIWGQIFLPIGLFHNRLSLFHATDFNSLPFWYGGHTVATVYDLIPLKTGFSDHTPDQKLGFSLYLHALRRTKHLIAISEATKRDIIEILQVPAERVTVIPLACDRKRFRPPDNYINVHEVLKFYNLLNRPYFFYVGSVERHKNVDLLLSAFKETRRTSPVAVDLIIGGKWSQKNILWFEERKKQLGLGPEARWIGFVPDEQLPSLYAGARAFIFPSSMEGFGLPVLEAMSCGTPVITTKISPLTEVAGNAALLITPGSLSSLVVAMRRLLEDSSLRWKLSQLSIQQASRFSWERTAYLTEQVYKRVLSGGVKEFHEEAPSGDRSFRY